MIDMVQEEDQAFEEKFDMYMECEKEDLVHMLIQANDHIDTLRKNKSFDEIAKTTFDRHKESFKKLAQ